MAADQIKRACQDYWGGRGAGPPTHPHVTALRGNFALLPHCYNLLVLSSFFSSLDSLINLFTEESNSKGLFKEAEKAKTFVSHNDTHFFVLRMSTVVCKFEKFSDMYVINLLLKRH